jgi:[ribosomal protein S18]-alanine N-acetyltransferase
MNVRQFTEHDLAAVLAIQRGSPEAAQWLPEDYARLVHDPAGMVLIAEAEAATPGSSAAGREAQALSNGTSVLGFAAFYLIAGEAELRNLAVAHEHRQRGIAKALLDEAHRRLVKAGVGRVYLETRASNVAALSLYNSIGYTVLSTREDYYRDPPEDACVLALDLSQRVVFV